MHQTVARGVMLACLLPALMAAQASEAQMQRYFEQGEKALAASDYDGAAAAYEKLRQLSPGTAEIYGKLGLIYFQQRNYEKAVVALRQGLKIKPALPRADILLAMSLCELGQYTDALAGLQKGFRTTDATLKRMCGLQLLRAYTGLKRDDKAVETALELRKLYPDDAEILYHSGRLFGNYAYLTMLKLSEVAPSSVWRHQAAGEALESQGDYDLAISHYREVLAMDPGRVGVHFRIGRAMLGRSGKPDAPAATVDEAAREFSEELRLDPTNANAAYELAELNRKAKNLDRARELFEAAVKYDPEFQEAQLGLGRVLLAAGRPEAALPHLKKALTLDPEDPVGHYHLSQAYRDLRNAPEQQKALAEYRRLQSEKAQREQQTHRQLFSSRQATKQEIDPGAKD